jgi:hypothetical protein
LVFPLIAAGQQGSQFQATHATVRMILAGFAFGFQ